MHWLAWGGTDRNRLLVFKSNVSHYLVLLKTWANQVDPVNPDPFRTGVEKGVHLCLERFEFICERFVFHLVGIQGRRLQSLPTPLFLWVQAPYKVLRGLVGSLATESLRVVLRSVGAPDVVGAPVLEKVLEIVPDPACAVWRTDRNNR